MPNKCVLNDWINELYRGRKIVFGVTCKPGLDYDTNPYETLAEANSYIWDNFITHKTKWLDHIWISECASFYSSLPFLIN